MPQLQFKGKQFVQNYHFTVPYRVLKPVASKSFPKGRASLDDNLIIHGDNLTALKALLPKYAGQIKCIYIDPPYNTGNEHWIYSDNVNSPMMKEWLGKEVGRDDLTRHDKWLCMMMPRLKLLRELLRDDGVIFVSIDDNEVHHLKMLMDEIFGEENFVGVLKWKKKKQPSFLHNQLSSIVEYIIVFARNIDKLEKLSLEKIIGDTKPLFNAKNKESVRLFPKGIRVNFKEGKIPKGKIKIKTMILEYLDEVVVKDNRTMNSFRLKAPFRDKQDNIDNYAKKDLIFITSNFTLRREVDEKEKEKKKAITDLLLDWGQNQDAFDELYTVFGKEFIFENPKPSLLIKNIVKVSTNNNDIILDSFAGSGTTAHAVLALNKEDGGNRKFILVEMEDYADRITAERIRRVIKGIPTAKDENLKNGLGGSFTFVELGEAIDNEGILSGKRLPSFVDMARYVFYTATGKNINEKKIKESTGFIGETEEYEVYLLYKPDLEWLKTTALDLEKAKKIAGKKGGKKKLVFAPAKYLDEEALRELNIEFAQLPFGIYRR